MGRRNRQRQMSQRMEAKTLDAKFLHEIRNGLNCSPFEADAVLQVVKDEYLPFFRPNAPHAAPGRVMLMAVDADEPAASVTTASALPWH